MDTTPNRLLEGSPRHHFYQLDHHTLAGCRRHRSEDAEDKEVLAEEQSQCEAERQEFDDCAEYITASMPRRRVRVIIHSSPHIDEDEELMKICLVDSFDEWIKMIRMSKAKKLVKQEKNQ
ncbi:hypothetical protein MJO29_009743 [Puccinia striiformis f. sp. tritici]|nr:hypothetical protein MJO29_009743 [Puccinia striiformis f. sp. tritici]